MKRLAPALAAALAAALLAGTAHSQPGGEPDWLTPGIRALRTEYEAARAALAAKRLAELRALLERHLEEQRLRQRQAKLSGNTTRQADAAQAVLLFGKALETLEREDTFGFPAGIRPALERMVALCTRALASADAARAADFKLLDTRFAGRLQPLLARQGITADPAQLDAYWQAVLKVADAVVEPAAADMAAAASAPAGGDAAGATNAAVLDVRGTAAAWVPLARIGIEVAAIEMVALPVAGLAGETARQGRGLESGAPWQAAVTPLRPFKTPGGGAAPAMRIRAVPGLRPLDVVAWPSRRNDWMIELRVRPPAPGRSRHGCVLEIDAAAVGD